MQNNIKLTEATIKMEETKQSTGEKRRCQPTAHLVLLVWESQLETIFCIVILDNFFVLYAIYP